MKTLMPIANWVYFYEFNIFKSQILRRASGKVIDLKIHRDLKNEYYFRKFAYLPFTSTNNWQKENLITMFSLNFILVPKMGKTVFDLIKGKQGFFKNFLHF